MSVRVDKWLWSVRVFPTRTAATAACTAGRVAVNGEAVKPATRVVAGDRVSARRGARTMVYVVVDPIEKRVSASVAAACYVDESPPVPRSEHGFAGPDGGARDRGAGRPTKRDRRHIDRLQGRE